MGNLLRTAQAALLFACLLSPAAGRAQGYDLADVPYGPDSENRLDVCRPTSGGIHAAVLLIHGGGWGAGDKGAYRQLCRMAADSGLVAVPVDYRLADGTAGHRWPAQIEDVRAAANWTATHAAELGIDRNKICALGESAGAQLAVYLAFSPGAVRAACVVDMYGPVDLTTWQGGPNAKLFGPVPRPELEKMRRDMSPLFLVRRVSSPFLIVYGASDELVPATQAESLYQALQAAGTPARLVRIEGGHEFKGVPNSYRLQVFASAFAFIRGAAGGEGRAAR